VEAKRLEPLPEFAHASPSRGVYRRHAPLRPGLKPFAPLMALLGRASAGTAQVGSCS